MADNTHIEWPDATWNPVTGCSVVSPGCTNCYAMRLAGTRLQHHPSRAGLTTPSKAGPVWNGQVRFNEQCLDQPLKWKRPRRIFVCAHGDLFHESVPDAWIDQVFAVMALAPQHTFQVLTKRAARMRGYLAGLTHERMAAAIPCPSNMAMSHAEMRHRLLGEASNLYRLPEGVRPPLPLPNVWLGVSAEDQPRADARIPDLLATPAAVRFVSLEPLLGPVDIRKWMPGCFECAAECGWRASRPPPEQRCEECGVISPEDADACPACDYSDLTAVCPDCDSRAVRHHPDTLCLDWVIVGGESGPGARDNDYLTNARAIMAQCAAAGIAFFGKQNVGKAPLPADLMVREYPHG